MPKNTIKDLRDHLFETLERLKDKDAPLETERARAIVTVSQAIIDSAKVEVELVKAVGGSAPGSTQFFGIAEETRALPPRLSASVPLAPRRIAAGGGK